MLSLGHYDHVSDKWSIQHTYAGPDIFPAPVIVYHFSFML